LVPLAMRGLNQVPRRLVRAAVSWPARPLRPPSTTVGAPPGDLRSVEWRGLETAACQPYPAAGVWFV